MSEFPSSEADELVTKQFLRAELATLRWAMEVNLWANQWLLQVLFEGDREVEQVV